MSGGGVHRLPSRRPGKRKAATCEGRGDSFRRFLVQGPGGGATGETETVRALFSSSNLELERGVERCREIRGGRETGNGQSLEGLLRSAARSNDRERDGTLLRKGLHHLAQSPVVCARGSPMRRLCGDGCRGVQAGLGRAV